MNTAETLGSRVRRLRVANRQSQADLAQGGLSTSYVSLIESGRREPQPATLELLAKALRTTVDYLLTGVEERPVQQLQLELSEAEMALRNGEPHVALDLYLRLAEELGPEDRRRQWRTAEHGVARAHERLGDLRAATTRLQRLREQSESFDTDPTWVMVLVDLARCYRESGDHLLAIRIAEEGMETFRRLGSPQGSEEIALASILVSCYYDTGNWLRAATLAQTTLDQAVQSGDIAAQAAAYWTASQIAQSTGELGLALSYSARALALYSETDKTRNIDAVTVYRGWLLMAQDPSDAPAALKMLLPVMRRLEKAGDDVPLAYCRLEVARAMTHLHKSEEAETLADLVGEAFAAAGNPRGQASALVIQAQAAQQLGRTADAANRLDHASRLLETVPMNRDLATDWATVAQALEALGRNKSAMAAYKHAAMSAGASIPPPPSTNEPLAKPSRPVRARASS